MLLINSLEVGQSGGRRVGARFPLQVCDWYARRLRVLSALGFAACEVHTFIRVHASAEHECQLGTKGPSTSAQAFQETLPRAPSSGLDVILRLLVPRSSNNREGAFREMLLSGLFLKRLDPPDPIP